MFNFNLNFDRHRHTYIKSVVRFKCLDGESTYYRFLEKEICLLVSVSQTFEIIKSFILNLLLVLRQICKSPKPINFSNIPETIFLPSIEADLAELDNISSFFESECVLAVIPKRWNREHLALESVDNIVYTDHASIDLKDIKNGWRIFKDLGRCLDVLVQGLTRSQCLIFKISLLCICIRFASFQRFFESLGLRSIKRVVMGRPKRLVSGAFLRVLSGLSDQDLSIDICFWSHTAWFNRYEGSLCLWDFSNFNTAVMRTPRCVQALRRINPRLLVSVQELPSPVRLKDFAVFDEHPIVSCGGSNRNISIDCDLIQLFGGSMPGRVTFIPHPGTSPGIEIELAKVCSSVGVVFSDSGFKNYTKSFFQAKSLPVVICGYSNIVLDCFVKGLPCYCVCDKQPFESEQTKAVDVTKLAVKHFQAPQEAIDYFVECTTDEKLFGEDIVKNSPDRIKAFGLPLE